MGHIIKVPNHRLTTFLRLWLFLILGSIFTFISLETAASSQSEFSVYCTSNFDATGECMDENSKNLECTLVSSNLIECANSENKIFECIQFGAIIAHQSQFSCVAKKEDDNSNKFNKTQNFNLNQPYQNQSDTEQQQAMPSEAEVLSIPAVKTSITKPSTSPPPQKKIIGIDDTDNTFNLDYLDAF